MILHEASVDAGAGLDRACEAEERGTRSASGSSSGARRVRQGGARTVEGPAKELSPFGFDLIARPGIESLFESVLSHTVTVLEAPAGYGKTAILWQWYRQAPRAGVDVVLLQSDEQTADTDSFLEQLNAALERVGVSVELRGSPGSPNSLRAVWQGLHAPCLVLVDDYPINATETTDELFGSLMRSLPPQLHFVVATRTPVRWPLCKLLLEGLAQRLGCEKLRFSQDDVARFLAAENVSQDELAALEEVVQGWPAALHVLQLARGHESAITFRKLVQTLPELAVRYVREQVLGDVPRPVLDVLLSIATLQRAKAPLLDALRNADDSHALLHAALKHGVPLVAEEGSGDWVSLHPFVSACLATEIPRLGLPRRQDLHLRAQKWLFEQGDIEAAVLQSQLAGDSRGLFELLEAVGGVRVVIRDGTSAMTRVLEQLPLQLVPEFPRLGMARALLLIKRGHLQEARRVLDPIASLQGATSGSALTPVREDFLLADHFVSLYEDTLDAHRDEQNMRLLVEATPGTDPWLKSRLTLEVSRAQHRQGHIVEALESALEAEFWDGEASSPYARFFVGLRIGFLYLHRLQLGSAREYYRCVEEIAAQVAGGEPQPQIMSDLYVAALYVEQNDIETAARLIARSMPRIDQSGFCTCGFINAYLVASRVDLERNGLEAALDGVTRGAQFGDRRHLPRLSHAMKVQRAALLAGAGRAEEALDQLAEAGVSMNNGEWVHPGGFTWQERVRDGITLARASLAAGETSQALQLATMLDEECEKAGDLLFALRARLVCALSSQVLGERDQAIDTLLSAFALAVPAGACRAFLDEGEPMLTLLRSVVRSGAITQLPAGTVDFVASLLGALGKEPPQPTSEPKSLGGSILSPREYEVLVALANGHSNKVIARQLELTENTVKFHLRSLYEKLGVGGRLLAVAVAKEKGILAS